MVVMRNIENKIGNKTYKNLFKIETIPILFYFFLFLFDKLNPITFQVEVNNNFYLVSIMQYTCDVP